ncbi:MAG: tetratricopeptide repeat protein [Deltaproteobacteria bacterium]|nr:tetratricopeptide repeat protein [Candidatus Anaeroferrophillacea bacterium]
MKSWLAVAVGCLIIVLAVPAAARQSEDALARVAIGAYRDGFYDVARQELETFVATYPESPHISQIRLILFLTYLQVHACTEAADIWPRLGGDEEVAAAGFSVPQLLLRLSLCLLRSDRGNAARPFLEHLVARYHRTAVASPARFHLGRLLFAAGEFAGAEAALAPLIEEPDRTACGVPEADLFYLLGMARYRQAKYPAALVLFESLTASGDWRRLPLDVCRRHALVTETAVRANDVAAARRHLAAWRSACPDDGAVSRGLLLVGEKLAAAGDYEAAGGYLRAAVEHPALDVRGRYAALGLLAGAARQGNREAELAGIIEQLLPLEEEGTKEHRSHLQALAALRYRLGEYDAAVAACGALFHRYPETAGESSQLFILADSLAAAGRCPELVDEMPRRVDFAALETPDAFHVRIGLLLVRCLGTEGRPVEAFRLLQRIYAWPAAAEFRLLLLGRGYALAREPGSAGRDWIAAEVLRHYSLDNREDVALLRDHPYLVYAVADRFYRSGAYDQALPSLAWLRQNLPATATELRRQILFVLGDSLFHLQDDIPAIGTFEELLPLTADRQRELTMLRLVQLYHRRGFAEKQRRLAAELAAVTTDEELRRALRSYMPEPVGKGSP